MKKKSQSYVLVLLVFSGALSVYGADVKIGGLRSVKLIDSGIPANERSVETIIQYKDRNIVATSGDNCHIFEFDASTSNIRKIAVLKGPASIVNSLALDGDDCLWVGTTLTDVQFFMLAKNFGIEISIRDIRALALDECFDTGHLYRICNISTQNPTVEYMGKPVPNQGIASMTCDPKRGKIYGFTYPLGRFFIYDISTAKTTTVSYGSSHLQDYGYKTSLYQPKLPGNEENKAVDDKYPVEVTKYRPFELLSGRKPIAQAFWIDPQGRVYTSGFYGKLIRWDPVKSDFDTLATLPAVPGRSGYNCISTFEPGKNGIIYGGTFEGYIFAYDIQKDVMMNFGKPFRAKGIIGLSMSLKGDLIYGVGGSDVEGYGRFFAFDVVERTFILNIPRREDFTGGHTIGKLSVFGVSSFSGDTRGNIIIGYPGRVGNLLVMYESEKSPIEVSDPGYREVFDDE